MAAGNAVGAQSGTYPSKPIRFLVGFNPGGGTDITARVVGDALSKLVGQTVIIDNRPAAGGVLARRIAADANPDGYTLLMLSGSQVIGASLVHKEPVDMKKDFAAISRLTSQPYLLTTHPVTSKPGRPLSATVGTSGSWEERSALLEASSRTRPALMCGMDEVALANRNCS